MCAADVAFLKEFRHHFLIGRTIEKQFTAAETVFFIGKKSVKRHDSICPRHVSRNMVRVCDTHIRRCICGDICDDIVVNTSVIGVKT